MGLKCFFLEDTGKDITEPLEDGTGTRTLSVFRRSDTGEEIIGPLINAAPGAMWYADWMLEVDDNWNYAGPDGHCLVVRCPNGSDWMIDGRASNCTLPNDKNHKCWVRHGTPPNITVDKNGLTCSAGAGSIMAGDYHGFLRNGQFDP